jgi:hypothetical protein
MTAFGEGMKEDEKTIEFNDYILQDAESIKQRIIERNRTEGGENGYDFELRDIRKGEYKPENTIWIRILPNFETKSAKLTINHDLWSLDAMDLLCIEDVKYLLNKWNIEEYCVCNKSNQFLMYYQPLQPKDNTK